jgi:hypothetical protein
MFRVLAVASALAIGGGVVCLADDPPAPAKQPEKGDRGRGGAQPGSSFGQPSPFFSPTTLSRYEEDAEMYEAQLNTKRAYVRAAEAGLMGSKLKFDNTARLAGAKTVSSFEVDLAKVELEVAKAQLDIRNGEMKEAEVKVKYAKKRLEDAKNAPPRTRTPRPAVEPKPVDPKPRS